MAKCVTRTLFRSAQFGLWWMASGLGFGCASQSEETKRQIDTLNERILILQNDRDRLVERVDALEQHGGRAVVVAPSASAPTRPALKVVRLTPEMAEQDVKSSGATDESAKVQAEASADVEEPSEHPAATPADPVQRVVLYGEGQVSGVREPASQEVR